MLTKIPHFKDIVICAFECSHCGERNNEIKSASSISDKGVRYTFNASSCEDMNRQVVVSEHATIFLEDLSLEIPPTAGKAYLNTIEGVIRKTYEDLSTGQEYRRINDRESFEKLDILLKRVERVLSGTEKTIFVIDDPSGNSYIENP